MTGFSISPSTVRKQLRRVGGHVDGDCGAIVLRRDFDRLVGDSQTALLPRQRRPTVPVPHAGDALQPAYDARRVDSGRAAAQARHDTQQSECVHKQKTKGDLQAEEKSAKITGWLFLQALISIIKGFICLFFSI